MPVFLRRLFASYRPLFVAFTRKLTHPARLRFLAHDLPEATEQSQTPPQAVSVTLTADNIVQVNEQVVRLEDLRAHLEVALASAEDKMVILRGDKQVVLGKAVYVLDQAQLAGAEGFALATTKPKKPR